MLRHATMPPRRAWYTWSSRPAEMVFLPLGVRVTPVAYAGSTGRATLFPPGPGVTFGAHDLEAREVRIGLDHAGTRLDWSYAKADDDPFTVAGGWSAPRLGEWGLRFWVNLCLSAEDGAPVRFDETSGAAVVKVGHRFVALCTAEAPVQVTGHASLAALAEDFETHGYFHLGSRAREGAVVVLRFNLEMMRQGRFAASVADRADLAIDKARIAIAARQGAAPALQTGRHGGSLDAIRDVMAWNTVWDEINARPYTSISRNWNQAKFGGFGVWLDDQLYAALLTGLIDPDVGRDNLLAALASATPQGNFACLVTANDAWVDRTQLPVAAFVVWTMACSGGTPALLRLTVEVLERNHAWWWANRDPHGRGLVSYGTSDVGEGLYKGTSFGARNESSMDNAPIHDEAHYDPATRTLDCFDVGLNSLLALDAEMLSLIAAELGDVSGAERHARRAEATRQAIRDTLWDESRGIFANRLWSGGFVRSLGPTSFYPLAAGVPTAEQTRRLLAHLADEATFGGALGLPGVTRDDPAFPDNTYWRGRIWPPLNYWVWQGLRRAGCDAEASGLARKSLALFDAAWRRRLCPENFNATTGEPLDQPDTDGFYGWGALMPLMGVAEVMDVSPWHGWQIVHDGADLWLGPIESPIGRLNLEVAGGVLRLIQRQRTWFETDVSGRLSQIVLAPGRLSMRLPAEVAGDAVLRLPSVAAAAILLARIEGRDVPWRTDGGGTTLSGLAGGRLEVRWDEAPALLPRLASPGATP